MREAWAAVRRGAPPPALGPGAETLVVWRSPSGVQVEAVQAPAPALLGALGQGANVAEACAALARNNPSTEVPELFARFLQHALPRGWLTGA